jgi:hypothetical protein
MSQWCGYIRPTGHDSDIEADLQALAGYAPARA